MSFIDHLEALRWHIIRSLLAIIVLAVIIFVKIDWVFDRIILGPIQKDFVTYTGLCQFSRWVGMGDSLCMPVVNVPLQANTFGTQFMTSISIAFLGGFIAAFPYVFWELWRFVKPALTAKELRSTRGSIFFVSAFFFMGAAFGYFLLAPFTYSFLANYQLGKTGIMRTIPTLSDYIENLVDIIIGSALAFQLPIISFVLTKIGIITPAFLKTYRKYAYVAILVIAAIITPSPDWMSQMIVTIPLVLLYEFSIRISNSVFKKQEKKWEEWE
jgi:sec-independent protein translocase protein TatC